MAHPFSRGGLYPLLHNRLYLGEIHHNGKVYEGTHPAIVPLALFDKTQEHLKAQAGVKRSCSQRVASMPFKGLLFDRDGNRMSPAFGYGRKQKLYRYYVSAPLQQGARLKPDPNAIRRVSAEVLETGFRQHFGRWLDMPDDAAISDLLRSVECLTLEREGITLTLTLEKLPRVKRRQLTPLPSRPQSAELFIPMQICLRGGKTRLFAPPGTGGIIKPDLTLVRGLKTAHDLAARLGWRRGLKKQVETPLTHLTSHERKLCRLAFLAPDLQQQILEGRQPPGLTLTRLILSPIPYDWRAQRLYFEQFLH